MPKIGNSISHQNTRCDRCGSKRRESKKWVEKTKTPYGITIIQHSQIICTNKKCQSLFEKVLKEDTRKREELRLIRVENSEKRKDARTARRPVL